jgi:hypothetical protein
LDEPQISEKGMATITAFSGDNGVTSTSETLAETTDELAATSDLVVVGEVAAVETGRTVEDATSVVVTVASDDEGAVDVELWPGETQTTASAVESIPIGAEVVAYLVPAPATSREGAEIDPEPSDLFSPTTRQGFILVGLDGSSSTAQQREIVWPLMGFSSSISSTEDVLPGGESIATP